MNSKRLLSLLVPLVLGAGLASRTASAQTQEISVQRFQPAPGPDNFLGVETARMEGDWQWSAGLFMNYALDPFVVNNCITTTTCSSPTARPLPQVDVVKDMITWDLMASVSPKPWLQLGLRFPLSYVDGSGLDLTTGGPLNPSLQAFGPGDPDIEAKFRLFGKPGSPLTLGVAGDISFPAHSTSATNFIGDSSPVTGDIRGIVEGTIGGFEYGGNLRAILREDATVGVSTTAQNTVVGPELAYGVAAGYDFTRVWEILAEGFGATGFRSEPGTNSFEIDGAIRAKLRDSSVQLTLGAGPGIVDGVGVPVVRVFGGLVYAAKVIDSDHDGIPDKLDKCPKEPEDKDGYEDNDGCPEPDNDQDAIPDKQDKCPNQPETMNGYQDADGCPDELPDRDHDGVPDKLDKCPDAGGPDIIKNPANPYYGCPDKDHDGVPDYIDKCPDVPEPTDDMFDGSGCPHVRDRDKDGIPDDIDKCPDDPETYNGYQDADGCPDKGPTTVKVTDSAIEIVDRIEFAVGKDVIQGTKSFQVLDAVAGVMKGHQEIRLIEVEGHTDSSGNADANRTLSQKRAEAVMKYLAGKGVEPARLTAKGYGPDKPIADNKTAAGKQKNRRVEFKILDMRGATRSPNAPPVSAPAAAPPAPAPRAAPAATPPPKPAKPAAPGNMEF